MSRTGTAVIVDALNVCVFVCALLSEADSGALVVQEEEE